MQSWDGGKEMSEAKPQDIVYEIIKSSRIQFRLPYITKTQIMEEAKKTSLGEQDQEKYSGVKSRLLTQVDQAISQLHKNGKIIKKGHGRWSINKFVKIKQIVCRHIMNELLLECKNKKCDYSEYEKTYEKSITKSCPECGKTLSSTIFKKYCPIKKCYIGDPESQCNVLFGTDLYSRPIKKHGDGIIHIPRCVGFTDKKPNAIRIEMSKKAVAVQDEREERDRRRNSHDIHDPISKKYLSKLHEKEE